MIMPQVKRRMCPACNHKTIEEVGMPHLNKMGGSEFYCNGVSARETPKVA